MNPAVGGEERRVEACHHKELVPPAAGASPKADSRLVPGAGDYRVLSLGPVDGEVFGGKVIAVRKADGNHDVPSLEVQPWHECLLYPELFQRDLSAAFDFLFELSRLFVLPLDGRLHAAMLEFDLHSEAPAPAEVVAEHDYGVGYVEAAVPSDIPVVSGRGVDAEVVAVHVVCHDGLAVASHGQPVGKVSSVVFVLRRCLDRKCERGQGQQQGDVHVFHLVGFSVSDNKGTPAVSPGQSHFLGIFCRKFTPPPRVSEKFLYLSGKAVLRSFCGFLLERRFLLLPLWCINILSQRNVNRRQGRKQDL